MKAAIVIPAYEPTPALADLVADLSRDGDRAIIAVDDGSSAACWRHSRRLSRCRTSSS